MKKKKKKTIIKSTNKYDLFGKVARRTPLLSRGNVAAQLLFAQLHLNKPQDLLREEIKLK